MRKNLDNFAYIHHIADAVEKVTVYVSNHSSDEFLSNEWDQAALMRHLEIIGEAASKLEVEFRNKYNSIEWRRIIDFRNVLIHDYMDVDIHVMWKIMTKNIPQLKNHITIILKDEKT